MSDVREEIGAIFRHHRHYCGRDVEDDHSCFSPQELEISEQDLVLLFRNQLQALKAEAQKIPVAGIIGNDGIRVDCVSKTALTTLFDKAIERLG